MTPTQREAALRLADWLHASGVVNSEVKETIALLRELAAEPQDEPVGLDAVRQAIDERDDMERKYHDLAEHMVYHGNSVSWWHSKAMAYRNAVDAVWTELKAAGIVCDGKKTCADGVRELAAAQGEHQQHWCTYCRGVNAHNGQFNPNVPRMQTYATTSTAPLYTHPPQQRRPLTDEFVSKVVRSVQPNLSDTCRAWKYEFAQCKHWLDAAHGIGEAP